MNNLNIRISTKEMLILDVGAQYRMLGHHTTSKEVLQQALTLKCKIKTRKERYQKETYKI